MNEIGPLLAIRADASNRGGTGHVMRTLAVAQEWLDRGGRVCYLCASLPAPLKERLLSAGCAVAEVDSSDDAASTAEQVERWKANVLLVDHYELPEGWWAALPERRKWRTAALNDFVQPLHAAAEIRISPTLREIAGEHSGPDYLLIRKELCRRERPSPPPGAARHLLLVLGGADPLNAGPSVAVQILDTFPSLRVRAIVGPAARNSGEFEALAAVRERLETVRDPESMAPHFQWADTAVVSPSTTALEALHHGLVTGLVLTAGNQEEGAAALRENGCAILLADFRTMRQLDLSGLRDLIRGKDQRVELASRGVALVDGLGARRACDLLGLPEIGFRPVEQDDCRVLWEWANDPGTRAASFSAAEIPWKEHVAWFESRLRSSDPGWIAQDPSGRRVAFVRFDRGEGKAFTISLNLAREMRGRGLGALLIARACDFFREANGRAEIQAWIKNENIASQRCFEKAGFVQTDGAEFSDRFLFIRSL